MAKLTEEEKARRALNRRRKEAVQAEEDAIRREAKRREWDENGTPLAWEEYLGGVPCRGCSLPVTDRSGGWPLPIKMDDEQREEYETAEADRRRRHPDCRSHVWMVEGSKTKHCGFCCPPLPMSQKQIKEIAAFLAGIRRTPPSELASWQLTLTCDHLVEKTQHRDNSHWSGTVVDCPDCPQVRGIVTAERLPQGQVGHGPDKRQRAEALAKARTEHERLQKKTDSAYQRIQELERQLAGTDNPQ